MGKTKIPIEDVKEVIELLKAGNDSYAKALLKLEIIVANAENKKQNWIQLRDLVEFIKIYLKVRLDIDLSEIDIPNDWF